MPAIHFRKYVPQLTVLSLTIYNPLRMQENMVFISISSVISQMAARPAEISSTARRSDRGMLVNLEEGTEQGIGNERMYCFLCLDSVCLFSIPFLTALAVA